MKLHLPTRLFRAVIAMMVAISSNLYATETVTPCVGVTKTEDIQEYVSTAYFVPFRLDSDLEFDALASPLMTYESGSRLFTSDSGASVIFSNADSTLFNVGESAYLQFDNVKDIYFTGNKNGAVESAGVTNASVILDNNKTVAFIENEARTAIGIGDYGSVSLSGNESVIFNNNSSSGANYGGGAISVGEYGSIALKNNGSVTFSGNLCDQFDKNAHGGAIRGRVGTGIDIISNGSVTFSGNEARPTSSGNGGKGGAIYIQGGAINYNESVTFSDNTAYYGGAMYAFSSFSFVGNGIVTFTGNTATINGGAILADTLIIRDNESVEFARNAEVSGDSYRLRSLYVAGDGQSYVSLSAAKGNEIIFRDSVYVSVHKVEFNASYTTQSGGVMHEIKQGGDIIFTGATTEADLLAVKGSEGTEEEILNSRTSEVLALTNLYGGRLRVEDGAVYKGYGITVHEDSDATLRVKDATLSHADYNITLANGTALQLVGDNTILGNVLMQSGSTLRVDGNSGSGVSEIMGNLQWNSGTHFVFENSESSSETNKILLYVSESVSGWESVQVSSSASSYSADDFTWVDGMLVLNYNEESFNRYFKEPVFFSKTQVKDTPFQYYRELGFNHISGHAIYCDYEKSVVLNDNGKVSFSGNTISDDTRVYGSAIYGAGSSTIALTNNNELIFSENDASGSYYAFGGAIYGDFCSAIAVNDNGIVSFRNNSAVGSAYYAYGGAIYGGDYSTITLNNNDAVSFDGNSASYGGAIYGGEGTPVTLNNNGTLMFSENSASNGYYSSYGGAIYGSTITLNENNTVTFIGNSASNADYTKGGALYGYTITLNDNGTIKFTGNSTSNSYSAPQGGAIYSYGGLHIRNNDSVEFAGNAEKSRSTYRLRSIYAYGGGGTYTVALSAAEGKNITFRDSIYICKDATVSLNENYNGTAQKGDILFTGATTEADLRIAKGSAGTASEITNSRTSEIHGATTLHAGSLRVEDKAVLKLNGGLTVADGSNASVKVKAAELSVGSHALSMVSGSSLELADGAKVTATELTITTGATLAVLGAVSTEPLTEQVAALTLSDETVAGFDASRAVNTGSVSVLEGDLTLESGSLLSFDDAYLELSGDLFFSVAEGEEKIALDIAPGIITEGNNQVVLFNVSGIVTFGFDALTTTADDGLVYIVKATDYFTGNRVTESMKLVYDSSTGMVYLENAAASVPEPTTTTLSLLALAALAARRRRK